MLYLLLHPFLPLAEQGFPHSSCSSFSLHVLILFFSLCSFDLVLEFLEEFWLEFVCVWLVWTLALVMLGLEASLAVFELPTA